MADKKYDVGSVRQKRKMGSRVTIDKGSIIKGMSTSDVVDSVSKSEKNATQGEGKGRSASNVGRGALKNLGFKMSKNPTLNFYDKWKFEDYPESVVTIFELLMKSVGVGTVPLNADEEDWVGNFMGQLHDKLQEEAELNYYVIPKAQRKLIPNVIEATKELIITQKKLASIATIQSLVRRRLVKNRIKKWLAEDGVQVTKTKRFQSLLAFRDLLQTEASYIQGLEAMVNSYLTPLRRLIDSKRNSTSLSLLPTFLADATVPITKEDVDAIFGNVETLLKVHQKIYQKFLSANEKWPFIDNIGGVFLQIAPLLVCYSDYALNCKNAMNSLLRIQEQDPSVKKWLDETSAKGAGDLMGLLLRPLNHISSYKVFLKVTINNTPGAEKDMDDLRNAYVTIKNTGKFIEDAHNQSSNRAKIAEVKRILQFPKGPYELAVPKREYISEGNINSLEKTLGFNTEKQRHYFLFTDLLIVAEDQAKGYRAQHIFPLRETTLDENPTPGQAHFALSHGESKVIVAYKSPLEKSTFMKQIKDLMEASKGFKMFGVSIRKLVEREKPADGIPFVVKSCIEYVRKKRESEGIFRISGGTSEVKNLRETFEKLTEIPKEPLDLKAFSPYTAAAILKAWFRELPEPILGFDNYKPLVELDINDSDAAGTSKAIKTHISKIPKENQVVLQYLLSFLVSVSKLAVVNKMNCSNLAIVFGPNLLFPREETLESILNIPKLNNLFQFILEHYTALYGDE